jgi:hypothetical protein
MSKIIKRSQIYIPNGMRDRIAKEWNVNKATVSRALNYKSNSETAIGIRKDAINDSFGIERIITEMLS